MTSWRADVAEFVERRGLLVRAVAWACFIGCVGYCSVTYLDTWNAQHVAGQCSSGNTTGGQNVALLLAIVTASALFGFLTNRWLVVGLGMLGILAFSITTLTLAFSSCGSPQPATVGTYAWYVGFFGGSSLTVGAVVAAVIWFIRYLAEARLQAPTSPFDEGVVEHPMGHPLIHAAGAIAAAMILVDIALVVFWGGVFVWPVIQLFAVGGLIVVAIGIIRAVRGH